MWLDALDTIFCRDTVLMDYVQQIVGMAAVGRVYMEALIIAYGEGSNGKSTFWNTIARVLGTYSGNMSADALTMGCKRNVKPELAEAKGKASADCLRAGGGRAPEHVHHQTALLHG